MTKIGFITEVRLLGLPCMERLVNIQKSVEWTAGQGTGDSEQRTGTGDGTVTGLDRT